MHGFIHSTESFGTVDGPGVRFVIFMQGCPMRCKYCHNPDTWEMNSGERRSAASLIDEYMRNAAYYSNGGITVTGGEPLMQIDFLLELFSLAKAKGIHICVDTSGITYHPGESVYNEKLEKLLSLTDLVMLDIKHIDPEKHKNLTGSQNKNVIDFAEYLSEKGIPLWVRHVVVKGHTDDKEDLKRLGRYLAHLKNLKALDVLPYHTMGASKYAELGIAYPLEGLPSLTVQDAVKAKSYIMEGLRDERPRIKK